MKGKKLLELTKQTQPNCIWKLRIELSKIIVVKLYTLKNWMSK